MSTVAEKIVAAPAQYHRSGQLMYVSYVWKCIAGAEVAYFLCLTGAFLLERTASGQTLHHTLFETLPGFVWLTPTSVVLGAVYVLGFALIFGTYIVWMHNSSIRE